MARLKKKFTIAPLSNGNVSLLADMAKNAGLSWDLILSAELARHYKPDRESYLVAAEPLSLKPDEVLMTTAHRGDLMAARSFGLRTGFIHRPNEYEKPTPPSPAISTLYPKICWTWQPKWAANDWPRLLCYPALAFGAYP